MAVRHGARAQRAPIPPRIDAGNLDAARACLAEAERGVAELGAVTEAELTDNVADLREAIADAASAGGSPSARSDYGVDVDPSRTGSAEDEPST